MKRLDKYQLFLLDLDGTLLDLNFNDFTAAYYNLLITKASKLVDPSTFKVALNEGINAMLTNDGSKTNKDAFFEKFNRIIGSGQEEFIEFFEEFYERDFPSLSCFARKVEGAQSFIKTLKDKGKSLVLATNPVFPLAAIKERLKWAGFSISEFDFISSFEVMKACKPNLLYFNQLLEEMGFKATETIMIGDDEELDGGAIYAGIDFVLVDRTGNNNQKGRNLVVKKLSDLLALKY
ncbi:MAG: HAD family hydrolase [Actinobacteria bacterium]|nr:HAD family hydrolase [Actinomycetota bacterium]